MGVLVGGLTHLDLFSGIGGFALAARWAGYRTVGFCEIEPYAQRVLAKNFGAVLADSYAPRNSDAENTIQTGRNATYSSRPTIHLDIHTLNGADYYGVNLLTGGFPCQPYSSAGKRRGHKDDRALWPEMLRVINETRPDWVIGENVAGLLSMAQFDSEPPVDGQGFAVGEVGDVYTRVGRGVANEIVGSLEKSGYAVQLFVVPACAVDAPHRRSRVWLLGANTRRRTRSAEQKREHQRTQVSGRSGTDELETRDDVAHHHHQRLQGRNSGELQERSSEFVIGKSNSSMAYAEGKRSTRSDLPQLKGQEQKQFGGGSSEGRKHCQWLPEPAVGRVANGIPARVDRLKGLGNAIVPQVAYEIIRHLPELAWLT